MIDKYHERSSKFAFWMLVFIGLGSFLYGYSTGIIAPALLFISKEFSLSALQQGTLVSVILLAALCSSLAAGPLADWMGRRWSIFSAACLFLIGSVLSCNASSYDQLLFGRAVTGLGVGLVSLVSPIYLAEIAPTSTRGAFVAVHQFAITLGILVSYLSGFLFSSSENWRAMLALGLIPAIFQILSVVCTVESPSFLLIKNHLAKAKKALERLRTGSGWEKHLEDTKRMASHKKEKLGMLFKFPLRKVLLIGIVLSIFQQITGINTVMYYAPTILKEANFSSASGALLATLGIGIVNVLLTFTSMPLLDRVGRKKLLLIGQLGMAISLCVFSLAFFTQIGAVDLIAVISLICYVSFFAIGLGPVTWVVLAEIYPLRVRGIAMGCATLANWFFNYLVSLTFLDLVNFLTAGGTFLLYAVISLLGMWFVSAFIPETKGKTLEEIERLLISKS